MAIDIVSTKYGQVSGVMEEGVLNFKGIPYAAPPVGELRWKPPADPAPWEGVRVCDAYGPRAMQPIFNGLGMEPYASDFYYIGYPERSEDCLYLNVTTDARSADEKRPVYMWFHGGGLFHGYSYEIEFNPTVLAKKGVIVVTVGQCLNIFGYLALPQLSAEQNGISGNYGLMDEVKALDWVRENIAAFGGDPNNITIGGQSGGTAKTGALARCPAAAGKIRRVINQSSLNWTGRNVPLAEGEQEGLAYIEHLGFSKDVTLEELRAADATLFSDAPMSFDGPRAPSSMYCDGIWVPDEDMSVSMDKYCGGYDYLVGGNYGECAMERGFILGGRDLSTAEAFYAAAKELLGEDLYNKYDFKTLFPVDDANANFLSKRLGVEGLTGFGGGMKNRYFGDYRAKKFPGSKTYSYVFSHVPPAHAEEYGTPRDPDKLMAWHSSELWYTFASLRRSEDGKDNVPPVRPWTETDEKLADQMSSYWANFIKTGDPNGEGLPYWPASDENYGWMDFAEKPIPHTGMEGKKDELLLDFLMEDPTLPKL